jgi:hypothetical protein
VFSLRDKIGGQATGEPRYSDGGSGETFKFWVQLERGRRRPTGGDAGTDEPMVSGDALTLSISCSGGMISTGKDTQSMEPSMMMAILGCG